MNKWIGMGRLTRDPEVRYSQGDNPIAVARYTMAIDRKKKLEGQQNADFINIVSLGKQGEFAEKYLKKGMKIVVVGRIQTRNYKDDEDRTVYVTEIVSEEVEFAESKKSSEEHKEAMDNATLAAAGINSDGFMNIPDGIEEELPFV